MRDFYNYLPVKYPNVKMCFLFASDSARRKYCLSGNREYLEEYRQVLYGSHAYIGEYGKKVTLDKYYQLGGNTVIDSSEVTKLCGYFYSPEGDVESVNYYINDEKVATSEEWLFEAEIDFTKYKGSEIVITVRGYSVHGSVIASELVRVGVI